MESGKRKTDGTEAITVRLSPRVKARLATDAKKEKRSMGAHVALLIERAIERDAEAAHG